MNDDIIVNEEVAAPVEPEAPVEAVAEPTETKDRVEAWSESEAKQNYRELEKFSSRQAQEVGESRKVIDQFNQQPHEPSPAQNIDLDSLLDNPTDTINRSLQNNPEIQRLQGDLQNIQNTAALTTIKAKHPDLGEIWQNPAFHNWVAESPVRGRLLQEAQNYNIDSADYILGDWKAQNSTSKADAEQSVRIDKAKADIGKATSESGGGKAATKVYSRHDLARLQVNDPSKYDAMWPEIHKAYEEGRVR